MRGRGTAVAQRSAAVSTHGRWARGAEQGWRLSAAAAVVRARGMPPTRTCSLTVVAAASPRLQQPKNAVRAWPCSRRSCKVDVDGLRTHHGQRDRAVSKVNAFHGGMVRVRARTFLPIWSKKSGRFASGRRLVRTGVSERASKITIPLKTLGQRLRDQGW